MAKKKKSKGWRREPKRHGDAARGIKTGRKKPRKSEEQKLKELKEKREAQLATLEFKTKKAELKAGAKFAKGKAAEQVALAKSVEAGVKFQKAQTKQQKEVAKLAKQSRKQEKLATQEAKEEKKARKKARKDELAEKEPSAPRAPTRTERGVVRLERIKAGDAAQAEAEAKQAELQEDIRVQRRGDVEAEKKARKAKKKLVKAMEQQVAEQQKEEAIVTGDAQPGMKDRVKRR